MTVDEALAQARALCVDRLDAQLLLAREIARPRTWLIAHGDHALTAQQAESFHAGLARRAAGEPLAYLLGEKEFHGLTLEVGPGVLVPRPDTETLVEWGLALLAGPLAAVSSPRVVDLGTGSGAIALSMRSGCPTADVTASDASPAALEVARRNAQRLGLPVELRHGDWWSAVDTERFHLALSNPPYIAEGDEHLASLSHEPQSALIAGPHGLECIERIIAGANRHLHRGGWLLFEHGHSQAREVRALLRGAGYADVQTRRDLAGVERCTGARLP
jgi:release factor glutamine methyltransferase